MADKRKILIVDDDVDLSSSLRVILEHAGYEVQTGASRPEGMAKVRTERPDLIVLDVMMETWQDGFEMCRELKGDPQFKKTPILMLTSIEDVTGIEIKASVGDPVWLPADAFLDKPATPEAFLATIGNLLQVSGAGAALGA
jgi:CheY-like chemotaxis protein